MKNVKLVLICMVFAAGSSICSDVFAQREVNSAQEAGKTAKESLMNRRNHGSSQIGWLNNVINVVNINEPVYKDVAAENNKAIEESKRK
jgi:hypothetical protein